MSNPKRVKNFLGRLESSLSENKNWRVLKEREEQYIGPYLRNKAWPGRNYVYMGHSQNLDHTLLGTNWELERRTCLSLLFEAKGDENYCVYIEDALAFEGFFDGLSRFEKELVQKLPARTLIGPAYDRIGNKVSLAFTIWRSLVEDEEAVRVLLKA